MFMRKKLFRGAVLISYPLASVILMDGYNLAGIEWNKHCRFIRMHGPGTCSEATEGFLRYGDSLLIFALLACIWFALVAFVFWTLPRLSAWKSANQYLNICGFVCVTLFASFLLFVGTQYLDLLTLLR